MHRLGNNMFGFSMKNLAFRALKILAAETFQLGT